jgi:hypothetical protein
MARGANPLPATEVVFTVNLQTAWYLDRLIETGLYGNTRNEAARIVLFDHCKLLIGQGRLSDAPAVPGGSAVNIVPQKL